ncbi:hypothetical protein BDF19DRAFT_387897 [Syncephalis fuscata]|nr:hypothetical protein BDF19DRAFT_387897 [Syncephalis fuscata]
MATLSISPPSILPSLSSPVPSSNSNDTQWPIYQHAVIGGTFDHLHAGHKILLTMAAWITNDRLFCGVTDGSMLSNKQYRELLEPLETRILHIEQFFNTLCQSHRRYTVAPITDPFGPTITDPSMDVIVVSRETYKGGVAAQEARIERQLPTMAIHVIDVVAAGRRSLGEAEWSELKLSSTQIRARLYQELSISEA